MYSQNSPPQIICLLSAFNVGPHDNNILDKSYIKLSGFSGGFRVVLGVCAVGYR